MSRAHVIIANDLKSGRIVYLAADGSWVRNISEAARAEHEDGLSALEAAAARGEQCNQVIGAEAIAVEEASEMVTALSLRDRIRAMGPTVKFAAITKNSIPG
jgi:hypothetical protein